MGNTLLNKAKGWPRGRKTGSCLCVFFLEFQEKWRRDRSDPDHRRRDSHVAKRAGSDL